MWRDEEGNRGGHLAGIRGENSCDSMGPGLQNAVSVKILPHPWQSFPVFGLPMDREREGCRGQNDAARLSRPALQDPPPQSHVDGVGRIGFLALHFLGFEWRRLYLEWSRSGDLPHQQAAPDKTTSSNAGWRGGCPWNTGFSNGNESLSRSQASSWHENSLLGEPKERGRGQVGKDWNVRTRPCSPQELEQVERCRRLPTGGSELPRVSGAGAGAGAGPGKLASVSKAASSQEPEPGPEEGETKIPNGKLSNLGLFSPNQYNLLPTRMPPPFHPDPCAERPSPSLASGSSSSSPFKGC